MVGHRVTGYVLACPRETSWKDECISIGEIALYDPAEHRPLAARFSQDVGVTIFMLSVVGTMVLGYPEAALADAEQALKDAREIGHAASLMFALFYASLTYIYCGKYAAADAVVDELVALADEKGTLFWKAGGMLRRGCLSVMTGKALDAVQMITSGVAAWRSTGATVWMPLYLSFLAGATQNLTNSMTAGVALAKP